MCDRCSRCCAGRSSTPRRASASSSRPKSSSSVTRRSRRRAHDGGQGQERSASGPRPPRSVDVRAFLGTAGYYRKFITDFSAIAAPLSELTKDIGQVRMGRRAAGSLPPAQGRQSQRARSSSCPTRRCRSSCTRMPPDSLSVPCCSRIRARACSRSPSCRRRCSMPRRATQCTSKSCSPSSTALSTWRHYLQRSQVQGRHRTDHKSLQHFKTQPQLSGRQTRWKDVIANFDFDIEYIEGKTNVVADGLSRRPDHSSCCSYSAASRCSTPAASRRHRISAVTSLLADIHRSLLAADPEYRRRSSSKRRHSLTIHCSVKGGLLYHNGDRLYIPERPRRCGLASCRSATIRPLVVTSARTRPSSR